MTRRYIGIAGLLMLACSTVARPEPSTGCESDDDCASDEVCSLDQGGVCLSRDAPPRAYLAFQIEEQGVVAELKACDEDLVRFDENNLLLEVRRDHVYQTLDFHVRETMRGGECDPWGACGVYTCDEDRDLCVGVLESNVGLRQASRIGLSEQTNSKAYPVLDAEDMPLEDAVSFGWGYPGQYDAPPIVLDVTPGDASRARVRRALGPDSKVQEQEFTAEAQFACHRNLVGNVRRLGGTPILGAVASVVFAEPVASPATIQGAAAPACAGDDECPTGLVCNPDLGSCGLDLTGYAAGEASTADNGTFSAWVYTYCDDVAVTSRDFAVVVSPPEITGLPAVRYAISPEFDLPQSVEGFPTISVPSTELDGDLCLPDWPEPETVSLEIGASPITLLTTDNGVPWRCCDAGCLPAGAPLGDVPPEAPERCLDTEQIRISTPVPAPDADEWASAGCDVLLEDESGNVGEYVRFVNQESCVDSLCTVELPPDQDGEDAREFRVDILTPRTSVFRSQSVFVGIDADTKSLAKSLNFSPRTLLRGEIVCAEGTENCTAVESIIIAERLRLEDESPPGPYLYWQVAYATSETEEGEPLGAKFSLPLNPGVYVITALPAAGSGGGPARYQVVDLRNGAPGVTERALDLENPIELETGLPVTVQLEDFARSALLRPVDTGSWKAQEDLQLPDSDQPIDLNDPMTCYSTTAGGAGCSIRSLTRPDAPKLGQLQSGRVQFTTRNVSGGKGCPQN